MVSTQCLYDLGLWLLIQGPLLEDVLLGRYPHHEEVDVLTRPEARYAITSIMSWMTEKSER